MFIIEKVFGRFELMDSVVFCGNIESSQSLRI